MVYMISYDLHDVKNYPKINAAIEALGNCRKPLFSLWIVDTALTIKQLNDYVSSTVDSDDNFLIMPVSGSGSGRVQHQEYWNWINSKFSLTSPLSPVISNMKLRPNPKTNPKSLGGL